MILVNKKTRLLIQGITGKEGSFHARLCRDYGTNIVAGVTPGKGGTFFDEIPVYNSVQEAVEQRQANATIIFVPPDRAYGAILEAIDANLELIVCITEGIPIQDMMKVKSYLLGKKTMLVGPNSPGVISPEERVKVGIMPAQVYKPGNIGVISRSGTLTYEISAQLSKKRFGQSTCIGIGGDPIVGVSFIDCLSLFEADPETGAVVMVGEIGGSAEEEAAEFIKEKIKKPVVAYICGLTAPPEKRMGHAGAIVSSGKGTAKEKIEVLEANGVMVAKNIDEICPTLKKALKAKRA